MRYQNDAHGHRISASILSRLQGEGGDIIVIDDPHSAEDANSDKERQNVLDAYDSTVATRLNDPVAGAIVIIAQRLHEMDLPGYVMKNRDEGWEVVSFPMHYTGKSYVTSLGLSDPRTEKGQLLWPERFPEQTVKTLERRLGTYRACTPGHTPILMGDWSEKQIEDVRVGDEIIGVSHGSGTVKNSLTKTTVRAVYQYESEVLRYTMSNGRIVECTDDHRWFRRLRAPGRPEYLPLSIGARVSSIYKPLKQLSVEERVLYGWLGGMLDGEGSVGQKGQVSLHQASCNPEVQFAINEVLTELGIPYNFREGNRKAEEENPKWSKRGHWQFRGGRSLLISLLNNCTMYKRQRFIDAIESINSGVGEKLTKGTNRLTVVAIESIGTMPVYALTTDTGNYIAWGFHSSNSGQLEQNPTPVEGGIIKRKWWREWDDEGEDDQKPLEVLISLDTAFTGRDMGEGSNFDPRRSQSACTVWGIMRRDGRNVACLLESWADYYEYHELRKEALKTLKKWYKRHQTTMIIEDKASGIILLRDLRAAGIYVSPFNPGSRDKLTRLFATQNLFESGCVFYKKHQGKNNEVMEQMCSFPKVQHEDLMDAATIALNKFQKMQLVRSLEDDENEDEDGIDMPVVETAPRIGAQFW